MAILPPPYSARNASPGRSQSIQTSSSRNRSLSTRSSKSDSSSKKHKFAPFSSIRGSTGPLLSRRLFKLIKTENNVINSYETAGQTRQSIATQLSEWGEQTGDDAVSELSDKLGVLLSEMGCQEEVFAQNLEDSRSVLKQIRNTESSVQPSRDHRVKIQDDINRLKYKDPTSPKIAMLEQEQVRSEAENLVAEAQLTNVTRAKLKEAYAQHFAAVIERSEKQAILARHGRRMLALLNDAPIQPGESHEPFERERDAREILHEAESEMKEWRLELEEVPSEAHPVVAGVLDGKAAASQCSQPPPELGVHPAHRAFSGGSVMTMRSAASESSAKNPPYPLTRDDVERRQGIVV